MNSKGFYKGVDPWSFPFVFSHVLLRKGIPTHLRIWIIDSLRCKCDKNVMHPVCFLHPDTRRRDLFIKHVPRYGLMWVQCFDKTF